MNTQVMTEMSEEALKQLDDTVKREMIRRHEERITRETEALKEIGREKGFLVDEIFGQKRVANGPKYRHPEIPNLSWSGYGRRPGWLNDLLSRGVELDTLRII